MTTSIIRQRDTGASSRFIVVLFFMSFSLLPAYASASVSLGQPNVTALSSGLVGYWPLDGATTNWTTGITRDVSGQGNNGSLVSMSTTTSPSVGKVGQSLKFIESTSAVSITNGFANTISGNNNHTVSMWFKAATISPYPVLLGSSGQYYYQLGGVTSNRTFYVQVGATYRTYTLSMPLSTGTWYHMTFVKNGAGDVGDLYINDIKQTSWTGSIASMPATGTDLKIGQYVSAGYGFTGSIDDVRVYSRALSAIEIEELYLLGL